MKEHNSSTNRSPTNPTRHAVIFLMQLRADLENRHLSAYVRSKPISTTQNIEAAMFLSENFLKNITNTDGRFQRVVPHCLCVVLLCMETAEHMRNLADTSTSGDPKGITQLRKLRDFQLKWMRRLQRRWDVLLQIASEFDESVTFRRLSDIIDSTEDTVDKAWLYAKERLNPYVEDGTHGTPRVQDASTPLQSTVTTLQPECKATKGAPPKLTVLHHASDTNVTQTVNNTDSTPNNTDGRSSCRTCQGKAHC